jgi:RimJ/RimL family protein N-acetyltransferase
MSSAPPLHLTIREIRPDDAERLRRLYFQLSPQSLYLRFFSPVKPPTDAWLQHMAGVDHDRRQAFVGVVDDDVVGVARFDRDHDDLTRAEIAVVVADAWQQHGLGTALLTRLVDDARARGITTLTATVLGENHTMLSLARSLSPTAHTVVDHGEWHVEIPIPPAGSGAMG